MKLSDVNKLVRRLAEDLRLNGVVFPDTTTSNCSAIVDRESTAVLMTGDNIDNLASLIEINRKKFDLCYIDPPYNTGNTFLYDDKRKSKKDPIWGTHADWMAFMLPRLVYAHSLLADDGFLAVSIDDYEKSHLKVLLDNIFGEERYIGSIVVNRSKNGKGAKKGLAVSHEYVIVYSKSKTSEVVGMPDSEDLYDKRDCHGVYRIDGLFRKKGDASLREDRPNLYYPLYYNELGEVFTSNPKGNLKEVYPVDSKGIDRRWIWSKAKADRESWKLFASKNGTLYVKNYYSDRKRIKLRTIWDSPDYLTERATAEIKSIFGTKVFDTPKPRQLIADLITALSREGSCVLDFFAGSGTTADAAAFVGDRDVVLMEANAPINEKHEAFKKGFEITSQVTKARLDHISRNYSGFTYTVTG